MKVNVRLLKTAAAYLRWSEHMNKFFDTPSFIALILVVAIVALVFTLAVLGKSDSQVFNVLVGGLMTVGFTNIVGFYFGSSASSKTKDETISEMVTRTGNGTPAVVTAAAAAAAPLAAEIAAPPAAEVAVAEAMAKRDEEHK
jgi:hypothetical protein